LLAITLSRNAFSKATAIGRARTNRVSIQKAYALGILSLLGVFLQQGKIQLRVLAHALIDPKKGFNPSGEAVGLPLATSLNAAFCILRSGGLEQYPWSKEFVREYYFEHWDLINLMVDGILERASNNSIRLVKAFPNLVKVQANEFYCGPCYTLPPAKDHFVPSVSAPQPYMVPD
jgi:hypothetical protein